MSRNTSLSLQWAKPGAPNVSYSWNDMANSGGGDGNSSSVTNQFQVEKDFGKQLKMQAGYQDTRQDYGGSTTAGTTAAGSDSTEALFGFTWQPSDTFNLSANYNNSVSTGNGVTGTSSAPTNSTSNMLQLAARWAPSPKLSFNLGYTGRIPTGR